MFKLFFGENGNRDCTFLEKFNTMAEAQEFRDELISWDEDESGDYYLITDQNGDVAERICVIK